MHLLARLADPAFCRLAWGLDSSTALAAALAAHLVLGAWLFLLGRRLPPGRGRLLAGAGPAVVANLLMPRLFCRGTDAVTLFAVAFNCTWLSSFKARTGGLMFFWRGAVDGGSLEVPLEPAECQSRPGRCPLAFHHAAPVVPHTHMPRLVLAPPLLLRGGAGAGVGA